MDEPIPLAKFREWGRLGGEKRMKALTPKQRKSFSRKGVNARKSRRRAKT